MLNQDSGIMMTMIVRMICLIMVSGIMMTMIISYDMFNHDVWDNDDYDYLV